jgi:hypothetical protein
MPTSTPIASRPQFIGKENRLLPSALIEQVRERARRFLQPRLQRETPRPPVRLAPQFENRGHQSSKQRRQEAMARLAAEMQSERAAEKTEFTPQSWEARRRIRTDTTHPFRTQADEQMARWLIEQTGIPLFTVESIGYKENKIGERGVLGEAEISDYRSARVRFYRDMLRIPDKRAFYAVAVHEMSHAATPFLINNDSAYGSSRKRVETALHVMRVAKQTAETQTFINPYHRFIYENYAQGKVPKRVYLEETHAIMNEVAATNREHLAQVDKAQQDIMRLKGKGNQTVSLVEGAEKTLLNLTRNPQTQERFTNAQEMYAHFDRVKATLGRASHHPEVRWPKHTTQEQRKYQPLPGQPVESYRRSRRIEIAFIVTPNAAFIAIRRGRDPEEIIVLPPMSKIKNKKRRQYA